MKRCRTFQVEIVLFGGEDKKLQVSNKRDQLPTQLVGKTISPHKYVPIHKQKVETF